MMAEKLGSSTSNVILESHKESKEDGGQKHTARNVKYNKKAMLKMRDRLIPVVPSTTIPLMENAIVIDIEATGFDVDETEMVQLAAVSMTSGASYNEYIYPANSDFSSSAASVTGMCKKEGGLYRNGVCMDTVTTFEAIDNFLTWLKDNTSGPAVLFSHSCKVLDGILLCKAIMESEREDDFKQAVVAFGDTFEAFKQVLRHHRKFSLPHLYARTFGHGIKGHDAMADALALKQLMEKVLSENDWGMLKRYCFTVKDYIAALK